MSSTRLIRNAFASIAQVVVSGLVLFELYRFLTRQLSVEQIGVWSVVLASTSFARLSDLGIGGGVVKFVAEAIGAGDHRSAARIAGMAALSVGGLVGVVAIALFPLLAFCLDFFIADSVALAQAKVLLPYALCSLWLVAMSTVFLSTLEGCQRLDLRALISTSIILVQLLGAYLFVPSMGIVGLAVAQVMQSSVGLLVALLIAGRLLEQPTQSFFEWDRPRFMALLRYGAGFQIAGVAQMLYEPILKILLAKFGGLELTGYYEMANRLVLQLRAVIVSAYQSLVSYVAATGQDKVEVRRLYLSAYNLLLYLTLPYYALIGLSLPLILPLWLGRFDAAFVICGILSCIAWMFNTLVSAAYFIYLAQGKLRWIVLTQTTIGVLNLCFCVIGGALWGGYGVVVGGAIALAVGSQVVLVAFHREYEITSRESVPYSLVAIGFVSLASLALLLFDIVYFPFGHANALQFAGFGVTACILLWLGWVNPKRPILYGELRRILAGVATKKRRGL